MVLCQSGLLTVHFPSKDADMTWLASKLVTAKSDSHFLRFLSGTKLLQLGAFERHFEPPERPVLLPTPGNSHTPGPMRSVAFVASSD